MNEPEDFVPYNNSPVIDIREVISLVTSVCFFVFEFQQLLQCNDGTRFPPRVTGRLNSNESQIETFVSVSNHQALNSFHLQYTFNVK